MFALKRRETWLQRTCAVLFLLTLLHFSCAVLCVFFAWCSKALRTCASLSTA